MTDMVLSLPMKLGLVKTDEEFYGENLAKKDELRKEQFAKYNPRGEGKMSFDSKMSFDEFLAYSMEHTVRLGWPKSYKVIMRKFVSSVGFTL